MTERAPIAALAEASRTWELNQCAYKLPTQAALANLAADRLAITPNAGVGRIRRAVERGDLIKVVWGVHRGTGVRGWHTEDSRTATLLEAIGADGIDLVPYGCGYYAEDRAHAGEGIALMRGRNEGMHRGLVVIVVGTPAMVREAFTVAWERGKEDRTKERADAVVYAQQVEELMPGSAATAHRLSQRERYGDGLVIATGQTGGTPTVSISATGQAAVELMRALRGM